MGIFGGMEEQYEEMAESLREKGIPLPSLTALFAILLLIIAGIYILLAQPFSPKFTSMEVTVKSNDQPVEGADVAIVDLSGGILARELTNKQGKASFGKVPIKDININARKEGIGEGSKNVKVAPGKITIVLGGATSEGKLVEVTLRATDEATQIGINGAQITYTLSDDPTKTYSASADANGKLVLKLPSGKAANLVLFHTNYNDRPLSIQAGKENEAMEVGMTRKAALAGPSPSSHPAATPTIRYGSLKVRVADDEGATLNANIEAYDAATRRLISSKTAAGGLGAFTNLQVGAKYFVKASLAGHQAYDGSLAPFTLEVESEIDVVLRKGADTDGKLAAYTFDQEGNKISARLQVISGEGNAVITRNSNGIAEFEHSQLSALEGFKIVATADGSLPASSEEYSSSDIPGKIELTLTDATNENSAELAITTKDRNGGLLGGANILIYSHSHGLIISDRTDGDGNAKFLLEKNENYEILSAYGEEKGAASILLLDRKALQIYLGAAVEEIGVGALDVVTSEAVDATYYSLYGGDTFDSCFGQICRLNVKTLQEAEIRITADGYFERVVKVLPSGDGKQLEIEMIPLDYSDTLVKFQGVYDSLNREVDALSPGEEYYAKMLIAAPSAERMGAYFRIGSEDDAAGDFALLESHSSTNAPSSIIKSTTIPLGNGCADEALGNAEFKWMNLEFSGAAAELVDFKFRLRPTAELEDELKFFYRGYAVKDGKFLRFPEDGLLGTDEKTASRDWCEAQEEEGSIKIEKSGAYSCNALGCISLLVEQDGLEARRDFQARNAKDCSDDSAAPNSCAAARMTMHISFMPNDPSKELDLKVSQADSRIRLSSYSINGNAARSLSTSSLSVPLTGAREYAIEVTALPQLAGDEAVTVIVQEAVGDLDIRKRIDIKIYGSCGNGLKDCGGGECSPICFGDFFEAGNPDEEELPEEPQCENDMQYCADGECREECEITPPEIDLGENVFVFENGKLATSIRKMNLQIDRITPADAVPLKFESRSGGCSPFYAIVSENTAECYSIEKEHLIFRGNELSPDCPLKSIGDGAEGDTSAKLQVTCSGIVGQILEIPIEVKVNNINQKAVQFQPSSFSGSEPKIIHILNQKQVPKSYELGSQKPSFDHADAYTYAISSSGTLMLTEDGESIDLVNFEESETYFPSIDNQGGRVAACHDYICCASQWCTEAAAVQAFSTFKEHAQMVASATTFRRQDTFISEEVIGRPFTFSTILRLVEKAKLPSEIKSDDSPTAYGCKADNPKIYIVQASSANGKEWEYTARIARLYKYDYVERESECKDGKATPEMKATATHSYQPSGDYLPLCNFLKTNDGCVEGEVDASFASIEQAEKASQLKPTFGISTFWRILVLGQACTPGETLVDFDLPDMRAFRFAVMTCPVGGAAEVSSKVCTEAKSYIFSDVSDNQIRAMVHVGITKKCKVDYKGLAIGAGGFLLTYKYPQHADTINALTGLISLFYGDLTTCAILGALQVAAPKEYKVATSGALAACTAISQMKSKGKTFGITGTEGSPGIKPPSGGQGGTGFEATLEPPT